MVSRAFFFVLLIKRVDWFRGLTKTYCSVKL